MTDWRDIGASRTEAMEGRVLQADGVHEPLVSELVLDQYTVG
jgi:hypothetical protein